MAAEKPIVTGSSRRSPERTTSSVTRVPGASERTVWLDGEPPEEALFSEHFACVYCQISLGEIEPRTFSFNSPHGACRRCTGLGVEMRVDPDLVIPDRSKSLHDGAIEPWSKSASVAGWYMRQLEAAAEHLGFSPDTPVR